jgi:2-polyprenyl-3-methyl-5-hydroxy-6-metoxy-1,4-benzoquinol methylase
MNNSSYLDQELIEYYDSKLSSFRNGPKAVDWKDNLAQETRFEILTKVCRKSANFSVNDLGCGVGDLYSFMVGKRLDVAYHGYDISSKMLTAAQENHKTSNARFSQSSIPTALADYTIASGIFNVAPNAEKNHWEERNFEIISHMWKMSREGIAFNMLSTVSDEEKRAEHLHYCNFGDTINRLLGTYKCEINAIYKPELFEFSILMWRV